MKITLYSDLHTEFVSRSQMQHFLEPMLYTNADVCVLAGDIASGRTNTLEVLKYFSLHYPHVVYLPGNHEYYGSSIEKFNNFPELPKNVYLLNPGMKYISDRNGDLALFIGAPLWTNFGNDLFAASAARQMITDFKVIRNFTPIDAKKLYEEHLAFIKHAYEGYAGKKVICTHFLPAQACIAPRWRGENLLNKYFANDLDDWISTMSNTTWLFGHTHDSVNVTLGDTRLIANPYGYPYRETNSKFDPKLELIV